MAIRIITDTSSDYDYDTARSLDVGMVSMTINAGEQSYADGIDLTRANFYDMLLLDKTVLKTSQPTPRDFQDLFEQARVNGDDVIAILLSGELSGTVASAQTARTLCEYDRIFIVDSRCATVGIQFLVEEALRMRAAGAAAKAIVQRLDHIKTRIRAFLGLDTLKYLYRGGRLSRVEAGVGTLTGIRPLLMLKGGKLEVCAKCMGGKKAMKRLVELITECKADPAFPMRFIYSYDDSNCRALMQSIPGASDAVVQELGPTLATHAGPGVYGAAFVEAE